MGWASFPPQISDTNTRKHLTKLIMSQEWQLKNPSISLYPFHLRDDRDEGYQQVVKNAQILWENLADNVGKEFNINELNSLRD